MVKVSYKAHGSVCIVCSFSVSVCSAVPHIRQETSKKIFAFAFAFTRCERALNVVQSKMRSLQRVQNKEKLNRCIKFI